MKKLHPFSFLVGILLVLIYDKILFTILSLNDIFLFVFKGNETLYIIGFIIGVIITNIVLVRLYKLFIKSEKQNLFTIMLLFILVFTVILFFGTNYYLGYLGKSEVDIHLQDIFFKYYNYKNTAYFVNTIVLLILYVWHFFRQHSKAKNN